MTMEKLDSFPSIYWINKDDTRLYDTTYKVRGSKLPPLKMVQQEHIYTDDDGEVVKTEKKWVKR